MLIERGSVDAWVIGGTWVVGVVERRGWRFDCRAVVGVVNRVGH